MNNTPDSKQALEPCGVCKFHWNLIVMPGQTHNSHCPHFNDAEKGCACQGCGQRYKVDVEVPDDLWNRIRPEGKPEGAGLLCGRCIFARVEALGQFDHLILSRSRASVAAVEGDAEKKIGLNVDGPFEQTVDKYHGELWIDKDGFANFKWHIEGGDFTSAREALVAFIQCLQDRLRKEQDCPYYERPPQPHTGALVDGWEGLPNDIKAELREVAPSFVNAIMALYRAADSSPAPAEPCGYCASPEHFSPAAELRQLEGLPRTEGRYHRSTGGGHYRCTAPTEPLQLEGEQEQIK